MTESDFPEPGESVETHGPSRGDIYLVYVRGDHAKESNLRLVKGHRVVKPFDPENPPWNKMLKPEPGLITVQRLTKTEEGYASEPPTIMEWMQ